MLVTTINRLTDWLQIVTHTGTYTCPTKEINGELFFRFKRHWHKAANFLSEHTTELLSESGKTIFRELKK